MYIRWSNVSIRVLNPEGAETLHGVNEETGLLESIEINGDVLIGNFDNDKCEIELELCNNGFTNEVTTKFVMPEGEICDCCINPLNELTSKT